jgi:general secretion pathway protein C
MTILLLFQKHVREILLLLFVLLGFSLGQLTATLLGMSMGSPVDRQQPAVTTVAKPNTIPPLASFKSILERNIFNAQTGDLSEFGGQSTATEPTTAAQTPNARLTLLGTVTGKPKALAIIQADKESGTYAIGASLPGGAKLVEVQRNQVIIESSNGRRETLQIDLKDTSTTTPTERKSTGRSRVSSQQPAATSSGIREIGDNRWLIPAEEADRARSNINDLLRQARVEPNIVDGQTEGFVVRMIRPGSLFSMLGLQVGDVLRDINGVKLDTPEKALQVFQQLREASQISIGLERQGAPQTYSYEIN